MSVTRRYGKWAGCPQGTAEDATRCIESVYGGFCVPHQCTRKRGHGKDGMFCKQHGKDPAAAYRAGLTNVRAE